MAAVMKGLIDAVDHLLRQWGYQQRRLQQGGVYALIDRDGKPERQFFPDGWPKSSIAAKYEDKDGAGASTTVLVQFPEDGIWGEALQISRALHGAPEDIRLFAQLHSVLKSPVKQKAATLGVSVSEYWRNVDRLRFYIAGRVPHETFVETTSRQ